MAKVTNRSGSLPRYNAKGDFPNRPAYPAPGSTGPAPVSAGEISPGPQRGLMRVQSQPGDPNFEADILKRQGFYPTKQKQVQTHSAMRGRRAMRGQPGCASDVLDQTTGLYDGFEGLDSAE